MLAPGRRLGAIVPVPEFEWAAQTIPHYDYLLEAPVTAAMLADGHCIPVRIPRAARLVWHKLYASTQRRGCSEKVVKDRQQALVLGAALAHDDPDALGRAYAEAPTAMANPTKSKLVG